MIKMDILDYGIYCEGKHIADADDIDLAKHIAKDLAVSEEVNVIVICNFTGEIVAEFEVRYSVEIVEIEP